MSKKEYKITSCGSDAIFNLTFSRELQYIYVGIDRYGTLGYYDMDTDQVVTMSKYWEQLERNTPGLKKKIENALDDYIFSGRQYITIG